MYEQHEHLDERRGAVAGSMSDRIVLIAMDELSVYQLMFKVLFELVRRLPLGVRSLSSFHILYLSRLFSRSCSIPCTAASHLKLFLACKPTSFFVSTMCSVPPFRVRQRCSFHPLLVRRRACCSATALLHLSRMVSFLEFFAYRPRFAFSVPSLCQVSYPQASTTNFKESHRNRRLIQQISIDRCEHYEYRVTSPNFLIDRSD